MGGGGFFGFFLDLFFLLPVILLLRAVWPSPAVMRVVCALAGLYLLYGQAPRFVPFFIVYWLMVWALQFLARRAETWSRAALSSAALTMVVVLALLPMLAWKISPVSSIEFLSEWSVRFLWSAFPQVGFADALVALVVPLGLSFATFRALDLLLKVYLGLLEPISLDRVLYYGFFPPILALGPISEYEEIRCDKPLSRWPASGDVAVGLFRIMLGIVKIFAIGMVMERIAAHFWQGGTSSVLSAWIAMLFYGVFFYANFSGYSEVAIGAARTLGFRLKENFANPYLKTNPQAFWNAWHMSLTRWVQRYVFVPLGGMRPERQYVAIFAVIMVIALWHGLGLPLVVFGLFHSSLIVGHRYLVERRRRLGLQLPKLNLFSHAVKSFLVFLSLSISFPLLILDTQSAISFYGFLLLGIPMGG